MPTLVVFDLDGVLVDSCTMHYETLNASLAEVLGDGACISRVQHERDYNGLSTRMKLAKLGLSPEVSEAVFTRKQELTADAMKALAPNPELHAILSQLRDREIAVWCASNCIRATVEMALTSLGIRTLFDGVLSNEDVKTPKPSPEMYVKCMELAAASPEETLIFEDSYRGLSAAVASGSRVWRVASPTDLTVAFVEEALASTQSNLMRSVNIVIPLAETGSRFATESLRKLCPGCSVVAIDAVPEGAACTVLKAKETINTDAPLVVINLDQYVEFETTPTVFQRLFDFLYAPEQQALAGLISTVDGHRNPKWSYVKTDDAGIVTEVCENDPFSDHATAGLYVWRHGSDFVKYAEQMIHKAIRVNNAFCVAPVFTEAIADGNQVGISPCKRTGGRVRLAPLLGIGDILIFKLRCMSHSIHVDTIVIHRSIAYAYRKYSESYIAMVSALLSRLFPTAVLEYDGSAPRLGPLPITTHSLYPEYVFSVPRKVLYDEPYVLLHTRAHFDGERGNVRAFFDRVLPMYETALTSLRSKYKLVLFGERTIETNSVGVRRIESLYPILSKIPGVIDRTRESVASLNTIEAFEEDLHAIHGAKLNVVVGYGGPLSLSVAFGTNTIAYIGGIRHSVVDDYSKFISTHTTMDGFLDAVQRELE